jgi:hypothetical protein
MTGAIFIATKKANKSISFEQEKAPEMFRGFFYVNWKDVWKLVVYSTTVFSRHVNRQRCFEDNSGRIPGLHHHGVGSGSEGHGSIQ